MSLARFSEDEALTHDQLMAKYEISHDGGKFHFEQYSYDQLEDAVAYARRQILATATEVPAQPHKGSPWGLIYIGIVVIAHLFAVTAGHGIGIVAIWYYCALPLFIPGLVVGAVVFFRALNNKTIEDRGLRLFFGAAPWLFTLLEWRLLQTLPSGYQGG